MRICYIAGGLHYTPSAGPSSHVISLVEAMARKGAMEVSLAFHGYREIPHLPVKCLDLYDNEGSAPAPRASSRPDDIAVNGINPRSYLRYARRCRAFVRRHAERFDAVVERMWRAGGLVGAGLQSRGAVYVLEENGPPGRPRRNLSRTAGVGRPVRWVFHLLSLLYARRAYSRPHCIVVQTEELKKLLHRRFSVDPLRVRVIPNGVNMRLFRPTDQGRCRRELGLDGDALMLLFVGSLDAYHDLIPCMEAMAGVNNPRIHLHVVGTGVCRDAAERAAMRLVPGRCTFHGPVPHSRVPLWINAADICIAPYGEQAFEKRRFYFSPLKILEYMACGKPVISQPHGEIARLVGHEYLIFNTMEAWRERLASLPGKEALAAMGRINSERALPYSWDAAADRYLEIIQEALP
ncbi:MAG: glycosyltransferase [Deltaproteobacteria bacterium]|nr:glycosyltransferase [Deltaproteobacteria bacterium]